ncbi:MAG: methylglyoxal synthase [Bacteriovoracia bacterium]
MAKKKLKKKKTIALIAHDGKKAELVAFVKDHRSYFQDFTIVATSTTGKHLQQMGLKVTRVLSGPLGGDAQIAALVATGACQGVIFMRDPLGMHPHEPDIYSLLRICDVHDVPLATNPASAKLLVEGFKS